MGGIGDETSLPLDVALEAFGHGVHTRLEVDQLRGRVPIGFGRREIAAGEPLQPCGPAIGEREQAPHVLLDRVAEFLMLGTIMTMRQVDAGPEMLALARLSCDVPDEIDDFPVFFAIKQLLHAYGLARAAAPGSRASRGLLQLAAAVAMSPDVPVPAAGI